MLLKLERKKTIEFVQIGNLWGYIIFVLVEYNAYCDTVQMSHRLYFSLVVWYQLTKV